MPPRTITTAISQAKIADATSRVGGDRLPDPDDIFAPLRHAPTDRPYVVAQLGQSLDGRIATPTGASRWINGGSALDHLHRLRAHVDAVIVGVGTIAADDPLLTVRRVQGRHPVRVVIDPNGRMDQNARCLRTEHARCIVVRAADHLAACDTEVLAVERRGDQLAPDDIVRGLFALGLRKVLIEGGASTVSRFINAGAVDRLHVLVAPIILGSGISGLSLTPIRELTEAHRPTTRVHVLDDGDVLFDCDLRQSSEG